MTWFPLSDELYSDPQFIGLSDAALALWTRAASWSTRHLTDGSVPSKVLPLLTSAVEQAPAELVEHGVWKRARGGFVFADWPKYATSEHVKNKRQIERDRKAKQRGTPPLTEEPPSSDNVLSLWDTGGTPAGTPDGTHAGRVPLPNQPSKPKKRTTPNGVAAASPNEINAASVVAAWVDACRANDVEPSKGQIGQVGKVAKELLAKNDPVLVLEAAKESGGKGFASIDRELTAIAARQRPNGLPSGHRDPNTGRAVDW